jgi:hypothetical protein
VTTVFEDLFGSYRGNSLKLTFQELLDQRQSPLSNRDKYLLVEHAQQDHALDVLLDVLPQEVHLQENDAVNFFAFHACSFQARQVLQAYKHLLPGMFTFCGAQPVDLTAQIAQSVLDKVQAQHQSNQIFGNNRKLGDVRLLREEVFRSTFCQYAAADVVGDDQKIIGTLSLKERKRITSANYIVGNMKKLREAARQIDEEFWFKFFYKNLFAPANDYALFTCFSFLDESTFAADGERARERTKRLATSLVLVSLQTDKSQSIAVCPF